MNNLGMNPPATQERAEEDKPAEGLQLLLEKLHRNHAQITAIDVDLTKKADTLTGVWPEPDESDKSTGCAAPNGQLNMLLDAADEMLSEIYCLRDTATRFSVL